MSHSSSRRSVLLTLLMLVGPEALAAACDDQSHFSDHAVQQSCAAEVCYRKDSLGANRFIVSRAVYSGWRIFRSYCHACHLEVHGLAGGKSLTLSADASPWALVDRIREGHLPQSRFIEVVHHGQGRMPPWKHNELVARNAAEIYRYLELRASCALPYLKAKRLAYRRSPDRRRGRCQRLKL